MTLPGSCLRACFTIWIRFLVFISINFLTAHASFLPPCMQQNASPNHEWSRQRYLSEHALWLMTSQQRAGRLNASPCQTSASCCFLNTGLWLFRQPKYFFQHCLYYESLLEPRSEETEWIRFMLSWLTGDSFLESIGKFGLGSLLGSLFLVLRRKDRPEFKELPPKELLHQRALRVALTLETPLEGNRLAFTPQLPLEADMLSLGPEFPSRPTGKSSPQRYLCPAFRDVVIDPPPGFAEIILGLPL